MLPPCSDLLTISVRYPTCVVSGQVSSRLQVDPCPSDKELSPCQSGSTSIPRLRTKILNFKTKVGDSWEQNRRPSLIKKGILYRTPTLIHLKGRRMDGHFSTSPPTKLSGEV